MQVRNNFKSKSILVKGSLLQKSCYIKIQTYNKNFNICTVIIANNMCTITIYKPLFRHIAAQTDKQTKEMHRKTKQHTGTIYKKN